MTTTKPFIYSILLGVLLATVSCESTHKAMSHKEQYKDIYVDQFKLTYLRQLLTKSFNNSSAVQEIINSDHSGFAEPVLTEDDYKLIDSLTTLDNQRLVADSTESYQRAEGAKGKRVLGLVMDKLTSKWLDNVARCRLKANGIQSSWR